MKMTAAVMYEQGLPAPYADSQPFRVEEVELDGPGPGEVLVEVRGARLCHSDLSVVEGLRKRPLPIVGGHEGAGIVREVGASVTGLAPGDHVAMAAVAGCGECRTCLAGRPGLCQAVTASRAEGMLSTGARRLRLANGGRLNHYSGISVYVQYAVVAPRSLVKIDPIVPLDIAALFGCAVVTGAGAVFNCAKVRPGSMVAVIGLGGVGLTAIMAAREAGAEKIIGIDVLPAKFDLAKGVGATDCVDARDPQVVQQVLDLTHGGVDYAFEISGNLNALAMAHGDHHSRRRGRRRRHRQIQRCIRRCAAPVGLRRAGSPRLVYGKLRATSRYSEVRRPLSTRTSPGREIAQRANRLSSTQAGFRSAWQRQRDPSDPASPWSLKPPFTSLFRSFNRP